MNSSDVIEVQFFLGVDLSGNVEIREDSDDLDDSMGDFYDTYRVTFRVRKAVVPSVTIDLTGVAPGPGGGFEVTASAVPRLKAPD